MERWVAVPRWEGWYEVSSAGRVRSVSRVSIANGAKATYRGKILATPAGKNGYCTVCLSAPGRREYHYVHRLVLVSFEGECQSGMEACHNDGDRQNNALRNLRYDTRRNNALDRHRHGTMPSTGHCAGERNGMSKLTGRKVVAVLRSKGTQREIAARFGISQSTVSLIKLRKTWRHVNA